MYAHILSVALFGALALIASPQEANQNAFPPVEKLDPSVASIEGDSLPFNSQAARLIISIPAELDDIRTNNSFNAPLGTPGSAIASRSLTDINSMSVSDLERQVKDVNAMRIIAFATQPGERITFNLKSQQSKVRMGVYTDTINTRTNSKLKAAIKAANMPLNSVRSKKLVFTNSSKEPYEMMLMVYGLHGYEYNLSWERKPKK
ncbi:MAG: hypothetical protein FWG12_00855 [Holophagaceae bacterium]|nr:hypothetical protein [Holophagaceae bacterium]